MPITPTEKIWMNGELVPWDDAQIHILTHTLHYGTGVFEGIRAYETDRGPAVFRLTEHIERLFNSAQDHDDGDPLHGRRARECDEGHRARDRAAVVLHPPDRVLRLRRDGAQHVAVHGRRVDRVLAVGRVPRRRRASSKGVRMKISSWTRHDHNTMPPLAKTTGNYVNSSLAKVEALKAGYDEAIMLNPDGLVSECTGENIFAARRGILITPPLSAGALPGITQDSVMTIAARSWFRGAGRRASRAATCTSPRRCSCAAPRPR